MTNKKNRTLKQYKQVGAEMRLIKELGARLWVDASQILSAPEQDKLRRAFDKINEVCSRADSHLFQDHPEVDDTYVDVFYGNLSNEPRNETDAEMIALARSVADDLFSDTSAMRRSV